MEVERTSLDNDDNLNIEDITEYALTGHGAVIHASSSPTIQVISELHKWLDCIKDDTDSNGYILKSIDNIESACISNAEYKSSDLYLAKKLKLHERFETFVQSFSFADTSANLQTKNNIGLIKMDFPTPIIASVLKHTENERRRKLDVLSKIYNMNNISMTDTVASMSEEDLLL